MKTVLQLQFHTKKLVLAIFTGSWCDSRQRVDYLSTGIEVSPSAYCSVPHVDDHPGFSSSLWSGDLALPRTRTASPLLWSLPLTLGQFSSRL